MYHLKLNRNGKCHLLARTKIEQGKEEETEEIVETLLKNLEMLRETSTSVTNKVIKERIPDKIKIDAETKTPEQKNTKNFAQIVITAMDHVDVMLPMYPKKKKEWLEWWLHNPVDCRSCYWVKICLKILQSHITYLL